MRDLVAMSIMLIGFTPYLEQRLSPDAIYGGSHVTAAAVTPGLASPLSTVGVTGGGVVRRSVRSLTRRIRGESG
jgi:hypothetical protein